MARKLIAKAAAKHKNENVFNGKIRKCSKKNGNSRSSSRSSGNKSSRSSSESSSNSGGGGGGNSNFFSSSFERVLTAAGIPPDTANSSPAEKNQEAIRKAAVNHINDGLKTRWPFDATIFLGDLNYRVDTPRLEIEMFKKEVEKKKGILVKPKELSGCNGLIMDESGPYFARLQALLHGDQLYKERQGKRVFPGFQEGKIRFLPTFKYDKRSNDFDSSAKQRCPAWCDRILYHSSSKKTTATENHANSLKNPADNIEVCLRDYYSVNARHSDHRPVCAQFTLYL